MSSLLSDNKELRSKFIDRTLLTFFCIAILSTPIILVRIVNNGLVGVFVFQLMLICMAAGTYALRKQLGDNTKAAIITLISSAVFVSSSLTFGFMGAGVPWLLLTLMFVSIVWPDYLGHVAGVSVFILVLIAAGFISGYLTPPIESNIMLGQLSFWLGLMFPTIAFMVLILTEIQMQQSTFKLQKQELIGKNLKLQTSAYYDPLTLVFNRRGFEEKVQSILPCSDKVCVIAIDIDFFKKINDNYGHAMGDHVLQEFAALLKSHTRSGDVICRYGGEEFVILSVDSEDQEVLEQCERLRQAIEVLEISHEGKNIQITASFGISNAKGDMELKKLIHYADLALYEAKEKGRNCIVSYR